MNLKQYSICTLSAALTLAMVPGHIAHAASHCKGLEEAVCGSTLACSWQKARAVGDPTKKGTPAKTAAKAHCRLDIKAAAKLASELASNKQPK